MVPNERPGDAGVVVGGAGVPVCSIVMVFCSVSVGCGATGDCGVVTVRVAPVVIFWVIGTAVVGVAVPDTVTPVLVGSGVQGLRRVCSTPGAMVVATDVAGTAVVVTPVDPGEYSAERVS
jgi:hypothetical protein